MVQPTIEEIQAQQGTRLSDKAPWETYESELDQRLDPKLEAAVAEYAERRYDSDKSSSQAQEELCRQREINEEIAKEHQWLKPEEYADQPARVGRPLTHAEFISKLRRIGLRCWYVDHPQPQKITLVVSNYAATKQPEVACWVQAGYMPELSMMNFDAYGAPLAERRRGWRTCLLQLILKGLISEADADKEFGPPKQTPAFERYNATLHSFRCAGSSLGQG